MKFYTAPTPDGGTMLKSFETLWEQGYRPYEIYTFNESPVLYGGQVKQAGTIAGWRIKFVFSTREKLKTYPNFDAVIGVDCMASVEDTWHG